MWTRVTPTLCGRSWDQGSQQKHDNCWQQGGTSYTGNFHFTHDSVMGCGNNDGRLYMLTG